MMKAVGVGQDGLNVRKMACSNYPPLPKLAQIKLARVHPQKARPRASLGEQKPMPLLRFVILKQSTDQRVGVSFVAEDEDELEYGAQRPARMAPHPPEPDAAPHDRPGH